MSSTGRLSIQSEVYLVVISRLKKLTRASRRGKQILRVLTLSLNFPVSVSSNFGHQRISIISLTRKYDQLREPAAYFSKWLQPAAEAMFCLSLYTRGVGCLS